LIRIFVAVGFFSDQTEGRRLFLTAQHDVLYTPTIFKCQTFAAFPLFCAKIPLWQFKFIDGIGVDY